MPRPSLSAMLPDAFDDDFKAEVIAAEMIEHNIPEEQIMILLLGAMKRSYRKDVDTITEEISDYNNKEYTLITTHKEGLYDMLPEGLFHSPTFPKSVITETEIIENIKKHRIEEQNARRFFLPYEAAINHLRIQVALYESRLDKGAHHTELLNIFKDHWEIFKWLDTNQSNVFLQLIPLIHDVRDDYAIAATIFELILSVPVKISSQLQPPLRPTTPVSSTLNNTILGVSLTTGNALFTSGEDELIVTIGPIDNSQLKQFMPGAVNNKIVELLCDYLLPVHLELTINYELNGMDKTTRLVDGEGDFNGVLGVSTYL